SGREGAVRDLISRLDKFVGTLDQQRDNIVASIQALNRLSATFAGQRDVLTEALRKVPPALEVLIKERPRLTTALDKLRVFSDTATGLINDTQADLVRNLRNLEPTIGAIANAGPKLDAAIEYASHFPFPQNLIDRAVRGDFFNLYFDLDFTIPRLKKGLLLGTHWGQDHAEEVPAPGDPWWLNYTLDPLHAGFAPPPPRPPPPGAPAPGNEPPLPGPPPPGPAAAPPAFNAPLPGAAAALPGPPASPPGFGPLPGPVAPLPGPAVPPPLPGPAQPGPVPQPATPPTAGGG
ncbi:MAG: MCE family protein, partial [Mycobacterium sp.]|nr:MCE family protein [Mycobacterium sp.]